MQTHHTPSPHRQAWEADVRAFCQAMTPRQMATEILDLGGEVADAERFDLVSRQVVALLAGSRLEMARVELGQRIASNRA